MRPLVRPPVICGILLTIETCSVGPPRNLACRAWRINVAHDLKNVDPVTNVPLAARVCYNVAGLPFSFQADAFQDILDYQAGGAGPLLSVLCAFMWFTKVRLPPQDEHLRRKAGRASALCFVTCGTCAGRARSGRRSHDDPCRRSAARQDDELRRRRRGVGRHTAPAVLPSDASVPDRRGVAAVLRRRVLHRAHDRAERPHPQLHRAGGATNFPPASSWLRACWHVVPHVYACRMWYARSLGRVPCCVALCTGCTSHGCTPRE